MSWGMLGVIVNVTQALEKQKREDELLVVARINVSPEQRGCAPQVGFELLLGDTGGHFSS